MSLAPKLSLFFGALGITLRSWGGGGVSAAHGFGTTSLDYSVWVISQICVPRNKSLSINATFSSVISI
jgi:hypothetical protein